MSVFASFARADRPVLLRKKRQVVSDGTQLLWGQLNVLLLMVRTVVPERTFYFLGELFLISAVPWLIIGFTQKRIRIKAPITFLLAAALQLWLFVCAADADLTIGRSVKHFTDADTFLLFPMVAFLQVVGLCSMDRSQSRLIRSFFIAFVVLSALFALGQLAHIHRFIDLSRHYNQNKPIDNWDGKGGVRTIGLANWPNHMAIYAATAAGMASAPLLRRALRYWEHIIVLLLLLVGVTSQSRTALPAVTLSAFAYVLLCIRRHPNRIAVIIGSSFVAVATMVVVLAKKLAYLLASSKLDTSIQYRINYAWKQVFIILKQRPLTGLGAEPNLNGSFLQGGTYDRFVFNMNVDNGYLVTFGFGGYPGGMLFCTIILLATLSSLIVACSRNLSDAQREAGFVSFICWVAIVFSLIANTVFMYTTATGIVAMVSGLLAASFNELPTRAKLGEMFQQMGVGMAPMFGDPTGSN
jgi:hypothetical protein